MAQAEEFVTLPGVAKELEKVLPVAIRAALKDSEGFSGCMVFISEQEARLVTVTTLWMGRHANEQSDRSTRRLKGILEPYVDRRLRTRRFAALLTIPQLSPAENDLAGQPGVRIQPLVNGKSLALEPD